MKQQFTRQTSVLSCTTVVRAVLLTEIDDTSRVSPTSLSLHPHLFPAKEPRVSGVAASAFLHLTHIP